MVNKITYGAANASRGLSSLRRMKGCLLGAVMLVLSICLASCEKEESPLWGVWEVEIVTLSEGCSESDVPSVVSPGVRWYFREKGHVVGIGGQHFFVMDSTIFNPMPMYPYESFVYYPYILGKYSISQDRIKVSFEGDLVFDESDVRLNGVYRLEEGTDEENLVVAWGACTCFYRKVQSFD